MDPLQPYNLECNGISVGKKMNLLEEATTLYNVLVEIQWQGCREDGEPSCPVCWGQPHNGHGKNCTIGDAIREYDLKRASRYYDNELAKLLADTFSMARSWDGSTLNLKWDQRSEGGKRAWRTVALVAHDTIKRTTS